MTNPKRKGARSTKEIPPDILAGLNRGELETANLVEWLAVDQRLLLQNVLAEAGRSEYLPSIVAKIDELPKHTANTANEAIGAGLLEQVVAHNDKAFQQTLVSHTADLVRCWTAYTIGKDETLDIAETLTRIQPFATDTHFGVREISWLAVRHKIAADLETSIALLASWAQSDNENIRRFASESTRPRGVWCEHIEKLKEQPALGLPILEALRADPAKYVRDSVGNWLNDASKTQPDFVREVCAKWERESETKETKYIIKKALRTIGR